MSKAPTEQTTTVRHYLVMLDDEPTYVRTDQIVAIYVGKNDDTVLLLETGHKVRTRTLAEDVVRLLARGPQ